jgi:hypothetical protein
VDAPSATGLAIGASQSSVLAVNRPALYYSECVKGGIAEANPSFSRAKNWVFRVVDLLLPNPMGWRPWNNYGIAYSQHMLPNANETQYAHNHAAAAALRNSDIRR